MCFHSLMFAVDLGSEYSTHFLPPSLKMFANHILERGYEYYLENAVENAENALGKAEEIADFTIVCPHWGTEYELLHSEQQKITAMWLVEQGADLIIGCHPHVVQDTTMIDGVPVAYSLGNLVSNMSAPNTQIGLMITVRYIRKNNGDIKMLPLELTHLWCSRPGGYCDSYTVLCRKT